MERSHKFNKAFSSKISVYRLLNQVIPSGVNTIVEFNAVTFDILNEYDEAVTYQFIPLEAGYYFVDAHVRFEALPLGTHMRLGILETGNRFHDDSRVNDGLWGMPLHCSLLCYLEPTYRIEAEVRHNSGANQNILLGAINTSLEIFRVG